MQNKRILSISLNFIALVAFVAVVPAQEAWEYSQRQGAKRGGANVVSAEHSTSEKELQLAEALRNALDFNEAQMAIRILQDIVIIRPGAELLGAVLEAMGYEDTEVRFEATLAFQRMKDPSVIPDLLGVASSDPDNKVRTSASEVVSYLEVMGESEN